MSPARERRLVARLTVALGLSTLAILALTRWVAIPWVVVGSSMAPTLRHGDRVLIDLWTYRRRPPRAGDMALLDGPGHLPLVKRVVRGPLPPGERIGDLVDPTRLEEPLFWVEGDNREISADSRRFGPVPAHRFRGRVLLRYWPPSAGGAIRSRGEGRATPPGR
jgi:signal peptidase I